MIYGFRALVEKYEKDGEDYFPDLTSSDDVWDYYEYLYNTDDLMCVKHKKHVIKSLKRKPFLLNDLEKNYKIDGGKSGLDFIITDKSSKQKYNIEFEKDSISITKQINKGDRLVKFEFYWSSMIRELF